MSEFVTIMESDSNPKRKFRKEKPDEKEIMFLDLVRSVRIALQKDTPVTVVTTSEKNFEEVFKGYSAAMKIYAKNRLLTIKSIDKITALDLDNHIVDMGEFL